MIDQALLRIIKNKEQFNKVYQYIPQAAMDKKTKAIVLDFKKYFEEHPEETCIDMSAFRTLFFTVYHKNMKDEQIDFYNKLLTRLEEDVSEAVQKTIINKLLELEFATKLANKLNSYESEDEIDIVQVTRDLVDDVIDRLERQQHFEFAGFEDNTVGDIGDDEGLDWHIRCLNETYRKIQGGDQYIIAGRPGVGKTSFITHLIAAAVQQMLSNKVVVWFNNESRRQRIMSRQIQSALNMTNSALAKLKAEGGLQQAYIDAMGSLDRVRVFDVHGKDVRHLEAILESIGEENVGLIVCDMLDNVDLSMPTGSREDQRLEKLYQWLRETGVKYNCATFPTSQVSNEGEGLLYPQKNMLKDSKTGKQGACDGILMIGLSDDPTKSQVRGISMPKTKTKREGEADLREEVVFDADRGRYL